MIRRTKALLAAGIVALAPTRPGAGDHGWSTASRAGRDVLVAAALGVPAARGDWTATSRRGAAC